MQQRDVRAIEAMGAALVGSGKPFVVTSRTLAMKHGQLSLETDVPDETAVGSLRIPGENACLQLARQGVRSSVVRLAPSVHGSGDRGFIPMLIAVARRTAVSAYIEDGQNRWPAVHRLDAARLFRLVVEKAEPGTAWHGASEEGVTLEAIAKMIGTKLQLPAISISAADAPAHFANPFFAAVFGRDAPASSARARALLGWQPTHATLLQDLEQGDYFSSKAFSVLA